MDTLRHKNENNKLMSLSIDDDKLLKNYQSLWNMVEDLTNIELDTLLVYDD